MQRRALGCGSCSTTRTATTRSGGATQSQSQETSNRWKVCQVSWFSSKIRIACLIESEGIHRYMDSVHLFKASDFSDAMKRALDLGKAHEQEYLNADGKRVRWLLASVISLDLIGDDVMDGVEVYSEPVEVPAGEVVDFDHRFSPEKSEPTQTV
ncbi:DUF4288 domain-containing protein [Sorangium sp. So ce406]|uniref:DUF4288 domain-containing protein n=1 Tax=Sorangium sp. So ce406 TaxID=3133311 RepID=UPI003F5B8A15